MHIPVILLHSHLFSTFSSVSFEIKLRDVSAIFSCLRRSHLGILLRTEVLHDLHVIYNGRI